MLLHENSRRAIVFKSRWSFLNHVYLLGLIHQSKVHLILVDRFLLLLDKGREKVALHLIETLGGELVVKAVRGAVIHVKLLGTDTALFLLVALATEQLCCYIRMASCIGILPWTIFVLDHVPGGTLAAL